MSAEKYYDSVVVGAGFSGIYMVYRLQKLGFSVRAYEAGGGVGGTWYWNRYPGARCDVESLQYSYSFSEELQQEWKWEEHFSAQPQIQAYAEHVVNRFNLQPLIQLETRVTSAHFNESSQLWTVETDRGDVVTCRFCIMASGVLSAGKLPEIPGISEFQGSTYHSGQWPHEKVNFKGKRVAVIGTGSSGIQVIPEIAREVDSLVVYQRTPNFSIPARNVPMKPEYENNFKSRYAQLRAEAKHTRSGTLYGDVGTQSALEVQPEEREQVYAARWAKGGNHLMYGFTDLITDERANATAAEFVRDRIREMVKDPETAAKLLPNDHPIGTKRICIDTNYYDTYNRPNVKLVDLRDTPILEITKQGVRTSEGETPFDCIVFATGFDAMTGALTRIDMKGRGGLGLKDAWQAGPVNYLGLMVSGFPNMFTVTGPGSPSVLGNMFVAIEQHVDWISDCLDYLRKSHRTVIEPDPKAQAEWVAHVNEVAHKTLYPKANSWYMGANVPGKPRMFMPYIGGAVQYREKTTQIAERGYEGFVLK